MQRERFIVVLLSNLNMLDMFSKYNIKTLFIAMEELLSAIKIVKMYCWESAFLERIIGKDAKTCKISLEKSSILTSFISFQKRRNVKNKTSVLSGIYHC